MYVELVFLDTTPCGGSVPKIVEKLVVESFCASHQTRGWKNLNQKETTTMKKTTDVPVFGQAETLGESPFEDNAAAFRASLRQKVRDALYAMVNEEINALCGEAWHPSEEASCYRAGSAPSRVYLQGERQSLKRPRVRRQSEEGSEEVPLKTWQLARDPEEWEEAMMRAVLCGVSTRKVSQLRPSELAGESRSSISRQWQSKAGELVSQMQQSDLSGFDLLVLMLDAVVLCKDLVATVALGIDTEGNKRILGFRIGSSENAQVCSDLLTHLKLRGLNVPANRKLLAVLDGSKALKNALLEAFPGTIIQRCLVHKERNLRGYLPRKHWARLAELFKRLRLAQGDEAGREAAEEIEAFLSDKNAQARESFDEAGEELLALFRLNVPNTLNASLLSTNAIENSFKNLRRHIGRVCRWREETRQAELWVASGLTLAEQGFRKIRGHRDLPELVKALEGKQETTLAEPLSQGA